MYVRVITAVPFASNPHPHRHRAPPPPSRRVVVVTSVRSRLGGGGVWKDLFVEDTHRGRGVGGLLLKGLCRIAHERGSARFHWQALDWNAPALDFYKAVGAARLDEWVNLRMDKPAMRAYLGL